MRKHVLFVGLLALVVILAACAPQGPDGPISGQKDPDVRLQQGSFSAGEVFDPGQAVVAKSFSSVEELESFLAKYEGSSSYYGGGFARGGMMAVDMDFAMAESAVAPTAVKASGNDGGSVFSETNNQVSGVDEGDIIKTDGKYVYTVSGSTLFVVDAYPGTDAQVISRVKLQKGAANGLFIDDEVLVVFGSVTVNDMFADLDFRPQSGMSYVEVYDLSDIKNPVLSKEFLFEGYYQQSRMVDGFVYLVGNSYPRYSPRPLPVFFEDGVQKSVAVDSIRYFPLPYDSVQFAHVHAINLDSFAHESLSLAVEGGAQVYMSADNLYLASSKYINEWEIQRQEVIRAVTPLLSDEDKQLIEKIKLVDDDVLSYAEKESKVFEIVSVHVEYMPIDEQEELQDDVELAVKDRLEEYEFFEFTVINKVSVDGLSLDAVASGTVAGTINNQFSLDERDGVLRVATTVNPRWSSFVDDKRSESENFVFTLDEDLDELDRLSGIAKTERIYSTRFMGDRLYMVTFRQVDPFFVIDLSNPRDIELLGELKVPGFSRYLHPFNDDIIIGLGRDASETGRTKGLKISLFDVSDVSDPVEIVSWIGDERYAQSTAEYEHHAFLFDREKELLAIPAYSNDWRSEDDGYNGAFVFHVSEEDIQLRGLIDHSEGAQYSWGPAVERSLFIEELLYTKSYGLLRINELDTLVGVKDVELKQKSGGGDIPVY